MTDDRMIENRTFWKDIGEGDLEIGRRQTPIINRIRLHVSCRSDTELTFFLYAFHFSDG